MCQEITRVDENMLCFKEGRGAQVYRAKCGVVAGSFARVSKM